MTDRKYLLEKRNQLVLCLNDADQRFNIALGKMNEITKRVHELEEERNVFLKHEFIMNLLNNGCASNIHKAILKEIKFLEINDKSDLIYQEVIYGYKSMSNRKNQLEEERNIYVYDIEKLEKELIA